MSGKENTGFFGKSGDRKKFAGLPEEIFRVAKNSVAGPKKKIKSVLDHGSVASPKK